MTKPSAERVASDAIWTTSCNTPIVPTARDNQCQGQVRYVMDIVKVELENCYGIRRLSKTFDFRKTRAYALYAPNGVMKSSLAQTFQDAADDKPSSDRIFSDRKTTRDIIDNDGNIVAGERVLVVLPYRDNIGVTEKTATLLIEPKLRKEYEDLQSATNAAKSALVNAIRIQSGSRKDFAAEISAAFTSTTDEFDTALVRIHRELAEQRDTPFASVIYDKIFNEKVLSALDVKNLKKAIAEYAARYNELLSSSTYFKKGTFDYYNAGQIARSLADNGFFAAKHTVSLNASDGNIEISDQAELEAIIVKEKESILSDAKLRSRFDEVGKQLYKNAELREFYSYIQDNEAILAKLENPQKLREEVIKSYLRSNYELYVEWHNKYDEASKRLREIEEETRQQRTQWEEVIAIFNDRFFVPFKLEAKNRTQVMLGQEALIKLGFVYVDGDASKDVDKEKLLSVLSTGEKKALYILNVIFEIETRRKSRLGSIIIVDDIADSFDYHNKYAIIQYLKDISEDGLFKLIIMTHNFDFFRTIASGLVSYPFCLMASKNKGEIALVQASGIKNVFANDWKKEFFADPRKKIACIPFLRNLIEMTTGEEDESYIKLTSMLHWTRGSEVNTVDDLDSVYCRVCNSDRRRSVEPSKLIHKLLSEEADKCLEASSGLRLDHKIVLSIAIRVEAEKFMIDRIADAKWVEAISANQTQVLITRFKKDFPSDRSALAILDRVALMTPENIHVNSFMYEPIIDMSDDHLCKLFHELKALCC